MITRDSILNRKLPQETVEVPEWDGSVVVRSLTAGEYLKLVQRMKDDTDRAVYHWIAAATFDEEGNRLFSDEDVPALEGQPYSVTERLLSVIMRLNPQKDAAAGN